MLQTLAAVLGITIGKCLAGGDEINDCELCRNCEFRFWVRMILQCVSVWLRRVLSLCGEAEIVVDIQGWFFLMFHEVFYLFIRSLFKRRKQL
jgi:hypothetical protein